MPHSIALWAGFLLFVVVMLILDLGVFHRKAHAVKFREALTWTGVWVTLALAFFVGVYIYRGQEQGLQFLAGYLTEQALSMDNVFVFLLLFTYFRVPIEYHHKVLFWGILGALTLRAVFIFAGLALIQRFDWMLYVFGAFLVFSGIKMARSKEAEIHPEHNPLLRLLRQWVPITAEYENGRFFVHRQGRLWATPLFVVLLLVESSDVIFAVDSVPAILAISRDPFIVYTSNVFAILGLRSLYFALAGLMQLFHYLHYGLSVILVFVGSKMLIEEWYHVPTPYSLAVIGVVFTCSIIASLVSPVPAKAIAGDRTRTVHK